MLNLVIIMAKSANKEVAQVGRFGAVGVINTLIDYTLFIALTKIFSLPLSHVWPAKLASGTVAMIFSFVLNRLWVFKAKQGNASTQAATFFPVTIVAIFGIQTPLVQVFSSKLPQLGQLGFHIAEALKLTAAAPNLLTEAFVIKTAAFALATLFSLTWNYLLYKYVVFRK